MGKRLYPPERSVWYYIFGGEENSIKEWLGFLGIVAAFVGTFALSALWDLGEDASMLLWIGVIFAIIIFMCVRSEVKERGLRGILTTPRYIVVGIICFALLGAIGIAFFIGLAAVMAPFVIACQIFVELLKTIF